MQINMNFDIEIKYYEFTSMNELKNIQNYKTAEEETLVLNINKYDAANFLFRFAPSVFEIGKYKIGLNFDSNHALSSILLKDKESNHILLVTNFMDLLNQINEAFIRIRTLEKMSALLELDFEDAQKEDKDGLIDEFDLELQQTSENTKEGSEE